LLDAKDGHGGKRTVWQDVSKRLARPTFDPNQWPRRHPNTNCTRCDTQTDLRPLTDRDEVTAALHARHDHIATVLARITARPTPTDPDD
jgi:hypothetical protein